MAMHAKPRKSVVIAPELWQAAGLPPKRERLATAVSWHTVRIRVYPHMLTGKQLAYKMKPFAGKCEPFAAGWYTLSGPTTDLDALIRSLVIGGYMPADGWLDCSASIPRMGSGQSPASASKPRNRTFDRIAVDKLADDIGKPMPIAGRI